MSGTSRPAPPLVVRTVGKESFYSACHSPSCQGIGHCGLCWCNLCIPSLNVKPKDQINTPHLLAFALQADGWYLRSEIIWAKPNVMPESVTDRPTRAHEYVFLLAKSPHYYYDARAVAEPLQSDPTSWGRHTKKDPGMQAPSPRAMFGPGRNGRNGTEWGNGKTRNRRSVWTVATVPFKDWTETSHLALVAQDAPCDGTTHIVSPSCPVHGGLLDLLATALCGEYGDALWTRIARSAPCPGLEPTSGSARDDSLRVYNYAGQNLDSALRECACVATERSKGIHKMALGAATTRAYKPSFEILDHTLDILSEHGLSEQMRSIFESKTWPGVMDVHLPGQTVSRKIGNASYQRPPQCACGYYTTETKKSSHFATFPEALVEPMVMAGSAKGDTVLDPFSGAATTGLVALKLGREYIGIELNPEYVEMSKRRLDPVDAQPTLF